LTRALLAGIEHPADVWLLPMIAGDRILVCSDGLTRELDDGYIAGVLRAISDPQLAADELARAAADAGGRDDVTALVIDAVAVAAPGPLDAPGSGLAAISSA
jgi:protein phosphatase